MRTKRKTRLLSLGMCLCMLFSIFSLSGITYAAETSCPNHQTHDAECGYVEAVEGAPCTHTCELCGGNSAGSTASPQDAVCNCTAPCTEGAMDNNCPVCGAEGALPEGCGFAACPTPGCPLPAGHEGTCEAAAAVAASLSSDVYSLDIADGDITVFRDINDDIAVKQVNHSHTLQDGEELSIHGTADNKVITFQNVGTESSPIQVELDDLHMTQNYENGEVNQDAVALKDSHVNFYLKGESTIHMSQRKTDFYCHVYVSESSTAAFDDSERRGEFQAGSGKLTLTRGEMANSDTIPAACIGGRGYVYTADGYGAPIGNTDRAGTMVFNGGTIEVKDGPGFRAAAAIGSGYRTSFYENSYEPQFQRIEVNGGHLMVANGDTCIGAGSSAFFANGTNNIIQINGGTVDAISTRSGSGIGASDLASVSRIEINGGTVNATGGGSGSTAGAGISCNYADGEILISGGTVNAVGGTIQNALTDAYLGGSGAGIGGVGIYNARIAAPVNIKITGGNVTARGGDAYSEDKGGGAGAGIGTGGSYKIIYISQDVRNRIEITGGNVKAIGGAGFGESGGRAKRGAPGIGTGGNRENKTCQTDITISGGDIYAVGGTGGIGSGTNKDGNLNNNNMMCTIKASRDGMIPSNDNFLPNIDLFPSLPGGNGSANFIFENTDGSYATRIVPVMLHTEPGAYVRAGVKGEMGVPLLQVRSSSQQADRGIPAVNAGDVTAWFPENQQDDAQFDVIDPGSRNRAAQGSKVKIMNAKETWVNRLEVPLSPLFADEILLNLSEDAPSQPALAGDSADQPFGRIDSFALEGVDDLAEIDELSGVVRMKQGASLREGTATLTAEYAGDMREPLHLYATVHVKIVSDTTCTITCETPAGRFENEISVPLHYGLAEEQTNPEDALVKKYVWSHSQTPPLEESEFTEVYDDVSATQTVGQDEPLPQVWYLHAYAKHPLVNGGAPTIETFGPYTLTGSKPAITTPETLPEGQLEETYRQVLQADSVTSLTWRLAANSALPPGLTLDKDTGEISGVPTKPGDDEFTVEAANTAGTVSRTFRLHIERIAAQGLTVSPSTLTLEKGEERQLTVTFSPENTTNQEVTYATSDAVVVMVTQDGKVKGVGAGEATITVTAQDGGYEGTCVVTVPAPEHLVVEQPPQGPLDLTKDAVFAFQGDYQNLLEIRLNGHVLTRTPTDSSHAELSDYPGYAGKLGEVKSGSVVVTLRREFLQTLPSGEYQLEVEFLDGRVPGAGSTTFEIATVITGLPESYTLSVGQSVSWIPAPAGGVWSYDKDDLEMTRNGDTDTFKALKAGNITATYTVDGVSCTVKFTINKAGEAPGPSPAPENPTPKPGTSQSENRTPQTGDTSNTLPFVLLALASLLGCIGLISCKKLDRKKRQG